MCRDARGWVGIALALLVAATPAGGQAFNRSEITALFFLPDGKTAIAACLDDKLHVYDVASGKERLAIDAHKDGVYAAALSADGKFVATGGGDGLIRLWDAQKLKEIRSFEGHKKEVLAVAFSPDGKTLASGGADRSIRTWDVAGGKEKKAWHGHELKVLSVAFSPDGKMLASGGTCTASIPGFVAGAIHADHVRLWDAATGKEIHQHTVRGAVVAFAPDGRSLVAAGTYAHGQQLEMGGTIRNAGTRATLGPVLKDGEWVELKGVGSAAALSPDGRLLALAYGSRLHLGKLRFENEMKHSRISLWETATGKEILVLPQDGATVVAISPDGKKLAAGFTFTQVQFWDLKPAGWPHAGKTPQLGAKELVKLWSDLAGEAEPAQQAIWTLAAADEPAVAFLKEKLQPEQPAGDQVRELLGKLDSDKYAVREAAFRDLKKLGPVAEGELRRAAADKKTSPEVRKRLQKLIDSWEKRPASAEELRQLRAIQVLERIASADARAVLARVAEGAPGAWLTQQAQLALQRLERHPISKF
jgi:hypothetical protein